MGLQALVEQAIPLMHTETVLFIDNDQSAGMQGFMSGQIKIEGDMSKLMAMQTVQPSADQKKLQEQILEITAA